MSRSVIRLAWGTLACTICGAVWFAIGLLSRAPSVIRIGINQSPPYAMIGKDLKPEGFSVEVLEEAAKRLKTKIQWVVAEEGPDAALASGKVDIWHLVTDLPSRHGRILFTDPYLKNEFKLVVLASGKIHEAADVAGHRVSHAAATLDTRLAEDFFPASTLISLPRGRELAPLCTGQADATLIGSTALTRSLLLRPAECASARFAIMPMTLSGYNMAIGSTQAGWKVAKQLRSAITDLSADGTIDRIHRAWLFDTIDNTKIITELAQSKSRSLLLYWSVALMAGAMGVMFWLARQQRKSHKATQLAYDFVSGILDTAGGLVIISDRLGQIIRVNSACERVTGKSLHDLRGKSVWGLLVPKREQASVHREFVELLRHSSQTSTEHHCLTTEGERLFSWCNTVLLDSQGRPEYVIATGIDITDRAAERERLDYEASHDVLTGLLNRKRFVEQLNRRLMEAHAGGPPPAVFFADLDFFKEINDTFGHATGDEVLRIFARLLVEEGGSGSIAGRMGGDEFCMLLNGNDGYLVAEAIRIRMKDHKFVSAGGTDFQVTATLGLAEWNSSFPGGNEFLSAADCALYHGKREGGNQVAVFENLAMAGRIIG